MKSENFRYLIIEASNGDYYGFNLRVKMECIYALTIVSPNKSDNFMVIGWKVTKILPKRTYQKAGVRGCKSVNFGCTNMI